MKVDIGQKQGDPIVAQLAKRQLDDHMHGPKCGHLAIAHVDPAGLVHVGFLSEDGELTCFSPPATAIDIPRGSLFNVCLESEGGKLGLHRRSQACSKKRTCWTESNHYSLLPVSATTKCNVVDLKKRVVSRSPRHEHVHEHPIVGEKLLKHDNHVDVLLNDGTGNLRLHCRDPARGDDSCHVKGTLTRVGNESSSSVLVQFMDWLDLFFLSDEASTSVIQVTKGLCCKKEIPKIESVLSQASLLAAFKTEIDAKQKTITVWHGTDKTQVMAWLVQVCKVLGEAGFLCEIGNVSGTKVVKSEMLFELTPPVAEALQSAPSIATVPENNHSLTFDPIAVLDTFSDSVYHVEHLPSSETKSVIVVRIYQMEENAAEVLGNIHNRALDGELPGCADVLIKFVGKRPITIREVKITKGLCCKKEIPKVNEAIQKMDAEVLRPLLCHRVVPKEKRILLQVFGDDDAAVCQFLDALIPQLESIKMIIASIDNVPYVPKPVVESAPVMNEEEKKSEATEGPASFCMTTPPPQALSNQIANSTLEEALSTGNDNTHSAFGATVKSTLSVQGVCCQSEVPSVLSCCKQVDGVLNVHVNVIAKQVILAHLGDRPDIPEQCAKLLSDNDFPSKVLLNGAVGTAVSPSEEAQLQKKAMRIELHLKWYVVLATILWLVSWLSYVQEPPGMQYLKYLSVAAVAIGLPKIALKGLKSLRRRIMDVNILMSIAVIGALALQDFHEAASVTVIFSWSDWLEDRASRRARQALLALVELKPEVAWTEDGREIAADAVEIGQVVVVRSGDKVPVDGDLLSPFCDVDESNLTGESRPVTKREGELMNAGTLNVSNQSVKMRCTALAENSAVARMIRLVEEASNSRSPTEQIVETVAKYYTPIVVLAAVFMASIPWVSGVEVGSFWLHTALTLLVVSCPCALIISTPITYVCGLAQAARFGVLVKGGRYLETLSKVSQIACDKTGTLTKGEFAVDDVFEAWKSTTFTKEQVLTLLRNMEAHATHPIAKALKTYCEEQLRGSSINPGDFAVEELQVIPGQGVKARLVRDSTIEVLVVGNEFKLRSCKTSTEEEAAWVAKQFEGGRTVSWLIVNDRALLGIAASDQVRATAGEALKSLVKMGVTTSLLTGDNPGTAKVLHARLPLLKQVFAGLTPAEKVEHVTRLKGEKRENVVAMIGDGVNDAPALSASDVGIAMGAGGAPLALETADCALMDNDLTKIPRLLKLARRTRIKILQNVGFSLISKAVMLGLTIAGFISLGVAIAVDVGSMLLVTLNGVALLEGGGMTCSPMRLRCFGHGHHHHHGQSRSGGCLPCLTLKHGHSHEIKESLTSVPHAGGSMNEGDVRGEAKQAMELV